MGVAVALFSQISSAQATMAVLHDLKIQLYPEEQRFDAQDTVTLPDRLLAEPMFVLHKGLKPSSPTPGVAIGPSTEEHPGAFIESFKVDLPTEIKTFVIQYGGKIHHPLELYGEEHARGFKQTSGIISEKGVYLAGSSFWYPVFGDALLRFKLVITLSGDWDAVSQGERTRHDRGGKQTLVQWESAKPHEEVHIIAAPFVEYARQAGKTTAMVFLRTPEESLASKYLDVTAQYLAMYEKLIGPYPYKKFALVENFWETGYGMASFTLLGPRVIRFPFLLHSSYPHEILHNWWGNSVFPDFEKGNWSEGLTAYLADHLIKEMRGNGVEYRQQTLQKYADYVLKERDFPLTKFRSRHSTSSEAVGYGKSLMVFHMLRQVLGDETFSHGLQDFYRQNQFQFASFDNLRKSFEGGSGKKLGEFFHQWTTRPGAPLLKISETQARRKGDGFILTAKVEQVQDGDPYLLQIPVAVTMEGINCAFQSVVAMDQKRLELQLAVPGRPVRIDVDPEFDLFRKLDRDETPAALTQALGARNMLVLLPSAASKALLEAYGDLARSLSESGPDNVEVKLDSQIQHIPSDRSVVLLGWENAFRSQVVSALSQFDVTVKAKEVRIGRKTIPKKDHALVLTARQLENAESSLTWVASGFLPHEDGTVFQIERGKLKPRKSLAKLPPVFSKNWQSFPRSFPKIA